MYGNDGGGFQPRGMGGFAPVNVGEELDVKIEAVGEKGDGIARKKGFVLFVPNTQAGDEVRIKVTKVLRKVGFAEVIGQAQGPIEEDAPKPRPERRETAGNAPPPPAPEPAPEDSDDFGAELEEDEDDLPPVEEPEEEPVAPAEEPAMPAPPSEESADDGLEVPPPPPVDGEDDEEKKEE